MASPYNQHNFGFGCWLRGFVSYDTMLASLPVLLMLLYTLQAAGHLGTAADERLVSQRSFDKLVSAADYLVEYGLVKKEEGNNGVYYPNWVLSIDSSEVEKTRAAFGMDELRAGLDKSEAAGAGGTCIYRLVAYGEEKSITKIYFCGG